MNKMVKICFCILFLSQTFLNAQETKDSKAHIYYHPTCKLHWFNNIQNPFYGHNKPIRYEISSNTLDSTVTEFFERHGYKTNLTVEDVRKYRNYITHGASEVMHFDVKVDWRLGSAMPKSGTVPDYSELTECKGWSIAVNITDGDKPVFSKVYDIDMLSRDRDEYLKAKKGINKALKEDNEAAVNDAINGLIVERLYWDAPMCIIKK
ncbi:MAG: hypothetical protein NTY22_08690 [Proteobacteria bacterium]|nr:hypothetical protein [Pseudomonadota bacterium]